MYSYVAIYAWSVYSMPFLHCIYQTYHFLQMAEGLLLWCIFTYIVFFQLFGLSSSFEYGIRISHTCTFG